MEKITKDTEEEFFAELDKSFTQQYGQRGIEWLSRNEDIDTEEDLIWEYVKMACDIGYTHGYANGQADLQQQQTTQSTGYPKQ